MRIKLHPSPVVGQPWAHGDSYPHRGTLANAEASPTTPQGVKRRGKSARFDTRDFRVECVYAHNAAFSNEVVRFPVGFRKEEFTTVLSRAKALDVVRDSKPGAKHPTSLPASYKHGTREGRARTVRRGPWRLVAVPNE